jgi:hypothetical protein
LQGFLFEVRIFPEAEVENFGRENLVLESLLKSDGLFGANHDVDALDVSQTPQDLLENNLTDETSSA